MSSDDDDSKKKNKGKPNPSQISEMMKSLGLDRINKRDFVKEVSYEVMVHKMGLVGILESMGKIAGNMKENILATPGRLPVDMLRLYFSALYSSAMFGLEILDQYQAIFDGTDRPGPQFGNPTPPPFPATKPPTGGGMHQPTSQEEAEERLLQELLKDHPDGEDGPTDDADDLLKGFFPVGKLPPKKPGPAGGGTN